MELIHFECAKLLIICEIRKHLAVFLQINTKNNKNEAKNVSLP